MSHRFQELIWLQVLSTTQAHFDWYEGHSWMLVWEWGPRPSQAWVIIPSHPSGFNNSFFVTAQYPRNSVTFNTAYRPQCHCKLGRTAVGLMLIRILMTEGGTKGEDCCLDFWVPSLSEWTILKYMYLQCATINLCFEAWCKCNGKVWSVILFTYVMVTSHMGNMCVHGIMQRAVVFGSLWKTCPKWRQTWTLSIELCPSGSVALDPGQTHLSMSQVGMGQKRTPD
jgi:hypothetical protein